MTQKTTTSRLNDDFSIVHGHLSADSHAHIHRELGELWSVSTGEVAVSAGDVLDIVVENPADSGNALEVMTWSIGANDSAKVTQYRDSGLYTGTATTITPSNFHDGVSEGSQSFNAEYQSGTGTQLIDTSTDDRFNGGFYTDGSSGSNIRGTVASRPELDITVSEGRSFGLHIEANNAVDPIPGLVIAEYEEGRDLEP